MATDNAEILTVWHWRKIAPRPDMRNLWLEVLPLIIDTMTCTAYMRKHIKLMVPHKLEIIRGLESGKSWHVVVASYKIWSATVYDTKKWKYELWQFMASSETVRDVFKGQKLKPHVLVQLDKVFKWLTAKHFQGKPITGPLIIDGAKPYYDGMKISDKCTFSEGWLQNLGTVCPLTARLKEFYCKTICYIH